MVDIDRYTPLFLADLAAMLPSTARVWDRGDALTTDQMILARIEYWLHWLAWSKTKDAQHGRNKPVDIVTEMTRKNDRKSEAQARFGEARDLDWYKEHFPLTKE